MNVAQDPKAKQTLMIVEDEALVATVLRDELQEAGYKVLNLTDRHAEALEVAKAEKPHLALVNIRLAGRDDGIELSEHLKSMGIPVLLISGQVSRASSSKTVAIASMPKPYDAAEMVLAVDYLLGRMKSEASLPRPHQLEVFDEEVLISRRRRDAKDGSSWVSAATRGMAEMRRQADVDASLFARQVSGGLTGMDRVGFWESFLPKLFQ